MIMKISGSDLHLFRVFDCVVRNNGLSAAQMELSLSQPTISNHLTAFEQRLGVKLCERGRRGFKLTEKGRLVHEIGLELLASLDTQSRRLERLRGTLVGKVHIGVVDCLASDPACPLSGMLAVMADEAPMVELVMTVMRPGDICTGLAGHTLDIGVGGFDVRLGGLEYTLLYKEDHALYCGRGDPLFALKDSEITLDMCYRRPWVHRGYWNNRRQRSFQQIEADLIVQDIEVQLLAVLSGAYLGLLPNHHAGYYAGKDRLRRLPVEADNYSADIMLVTRSGRMPRTVAYVRDLLLKQV